MTTLAPKRPTETRRYVFDFAEELGDDTIQAFQLVVMTGTVNIDSQVQSAPQAFTAFISGGADGVASTLELSMTTEAGQLLYRDYALLTANASNATGALPSSTTKGQIVAMVYEECGLAGFNIDATADEQASALRRLDSLMWTWSSPGVGLDLGYNFPTAIGGSALTDISGIPDLALDAVVLTLAKSFAPAIGKTLSAESRARLAESMRALRASYAAIPWTQFPSRTISGAGAKPFSTWRPFMGLSRFAPPSTSSGILVAEDGDIIITEGGESIGA